MISRNILVTSTCENRSIALHENDSQTGPSFVRMTNDCVLDLSDINMSVFGRLVCESFMLASLTFSSFFSRNWFFRFYLRVSREVASRKYV